MQAKIAVCIFSVLLLFPMWMGSADALPDTTVSIREHGVSIQLTYPDEAHPAESIWHNITLTSTVASTLRNFTVVIKVSVNSGWLEILNSQDTFSKPLPLTYNLNLSLPQEADGMIQCVLVVKTNSIDDLSIVFYTSHIRKMTYSELLGNYNVLYSTCNQLVADYDTLNNTYYDLMSNYEAMNSSYNDLSAHFMILNNTYNQLKADYDILNDTYANLQSNYAALNASYMVLSGNYSILNNSYNALKNKNSEIELNYNNSRSSSNVLLGEYNELQYEYNLLNSTYNNLTETKNSLQSDYDALDTEYKKLLQDLNTLEDNASTMGSDLTIDKIVMFIFVVVVAALVGFVIYLKRKTQEPYLVIRKETVSMNRDEEASPSNQTGIKVK
jgi:predicted nuclease with TOPRIM domain